MAFTAPKRLRWLAIALLLAIIAVLGCGLRLMNVYLDTNYYSQAVGPHDTLIWRTAFWCSVASAAGLTLLLVKRGRESPAT